MKTDNIRIKKKDSGLLPMGLLYLAILLLGVFLLCTPLLSFAPESGTQRILLFAGGALCVGIGAALYGRLLYRGICPPDALVITNKGFTNYLIDSKEGVYVEWVNVASIRIFGMSKSPMLGLMLEDHEAYLSLLEGKAKRDALSNLELNLPVISIAQQDVMVPIAELKSLFSRMVKGALSWENYAAQSKKESKPASNSLTSSPVSTVPSDEAQQKEPVVVGSHSQTAEVVSHPESLFTAVPTTAKPEPKTASPTPAAEQETFFQPESVATPKEPIAQTPRRSFDFDTLETTLEPTAKTREMPSSSPASDRTVPFEENHRPDAMTQPKPEQPVSSKKKPLAPEPTTSTQPSRPITNAPEDLQIDQFQKIDDEEVVLLDMDND